jgi:hypothetical protein
MIKRIAVAVLVLCGLVGSTVMAHTHQHQVQTMNDATASNSDAWRHYLLQTGELAEVGARSTSSDVLVAQAKEFTAKFKKAILEFNAKQALRSTDVEQQQAMEGFLAERDALVAQYQNNLASGLGPVNYNKLVQVVNTFRSSIKSTNPVEHLYASAGAPQQIQSKSPTCNGIITCSMTFSVTYAPVFVDISQWPPAPQIKTAFSVLIDGSETMHCPGNCVPGTLHTPTVSFVHAGVNYSTNGNRVCPNCYLYASEAPAFLQGVGDPIDINGGDATLFCTSAGDFLNVSAAFFTYEYAVTLSKTATPTTNGYNSSTTGNWYYPDQTVCPSSNPGCIPNAGWNSNTSIGYYTQEDWCNNSTVPDATLNYYTAALPTLYFCPTQGTCGTLSGGQAPTQAGWFNVGVSLLWHLPGGTTWYNAVPGFGPASVAYYPDGNWELALYGMAIEQLSTTGTNPQKIACTATPGFTNIAVAQEYRKM